MSGFSFRGVHSSTFGIYTKDQGKILLPPRREGKLTIPGRSGYYDDVARSTTSGSRVSFALSSGQRARLYRKCAGR